MTLLFKSESINLKKSTRSEIAHKTSIVIIFTRRGGVTTLPLVPKYQSNHQRHNLCINIYNTYTYGQHQ